MEPSKSLLERLNFDDGLRGPSRVRGGYEDALTQFLIFCASPIVLSGPICLFMTLLIPEVTGLDLVLARVGSAATHMLSAWDAHLP